MELPVILLAFANDRQNDAAYLRNLPVELNGLKEILDRCAEQGLCEVEILPNATLNQIVKSFQKYRGRIALFHYAGHANSFELLLEDASGNNAAAHAGGLVPFLGEQPGLQAVFLNACLSSLQAIALNKAGIPAVIGTVSTVNDQLATRLAIGFYSGLARGLTISTAWREATLEQRATGGKLTERYYRPDQSEVDNSRGMSLDELNDKDRFPWEIYYRPGAEQVSQWNLPQAAGDPYFGLPKISQDLPFPASPYRYLERYRPEDARIFFGRGAYIRDLYFQLADERGAPIIALYGQSGVGKSSLLAAGLLPRLEKEFTVLYLRRSSQGTVADLLQTLGSELDQEDEAQISEESELERDIEQLQASLERLEGGAREQVAKVIDEMKTTRKQELLLRRGQHPLSAWKAMETQNGKPLVIILDQVEELFTRPNPKIKNEIEQLGRLCQLLFNSPTDRPRGKLLLSYRKEYDPEIDAVLQRMELYREKVFVDRLDRKGIKEVILGLSNSKQLSRQYRLEVEEELPALITNDLMRDRHSALSPMLQIILTKLWLKVKNDDHPRFTVSDYLTLKEEGILLEDFYTQQMEQIRAWENRIKQTVESSGLALDVLYFHTTTLGTAEQRSLEDLRTHYQHRQDILDQLVTEFKSLYLLSSTGSELTGLTHDTLAPIVQQAIRQSNRPGQRALRILEAKQIEYQQSPQTTFLDGNDLQLVEEGANGMRVWQPKERELIKKSRQKRQRRRWLRLFLTGLGVALLLSIALMVRQSIALDQKQTISELQNEALFLEASGQPNAALKTIRKAFMVDRTDPSTLIIQNNIYEKNEFFFKTFPLDKAPNTLVFHPNGQQLVVGVENTVLLIDTSGNQTAIQAFETTVNALAIAADGRQVWCGNQDGKVMLWDLEKGTSSLVTTHLDQPVHAVAFVPAANAVLSAGGDGQVFLSDSDGRRLLSMQEEHEGAVLSLAVSPDGDQYLSGGADGRVVLWSAQGTVERVFRGHQDLVLSVAFSPDGQFIISGGRDRRINIWNREGELIRQLLDHEKRVNKIIPFYPERGKGPWQFYSCSDDGQVKRWDQSGQLLATYHGHSSFVTDIAVSPDGHYLLSAGEEGALKLWRRESKVRRHWGPYENEVRSLVIDANAAVMAVGIGGGDLNLGNQINANDFTLDLDVLLGGGSSERQPIHLQSLGKKDSTTVIPAHPKAVQALAFDSAGRLLSGGGEKTARIWNRNGAAIGTLEGHRGDILSAAFAPDAYDGQMLTGSADSTAILWDSTGTMIHTFSPHRGWVTQARFSPAGDRILTTGYDGVLRLWNTSGVLLDTIDAHAGRVEAAIFSPNGQYILSGGWDNRVKLWSTDGDLLLELLLRNKNNSGGQAVNSLAFSPDSQFFLVGTEGGVAKVFDRQGQLIQSLQDFGQMGVYSVMFSADGTRLFIGSGDGWVREYPFLGVLDKIE